MTIFKQHQKWLLASSSSKRSEYLKLYNFNFDSFNPDIDETPLKNESAINYVKRLAKDKAIEAKKLNDHNVIIAADTTFNVKGKIIGKASKELSEIDILQLLSGTTHEVITAVYVFISNQRPIKIESSCMVEFFDYPKEVLLAYIASGEATSNAGACAIEEMGAFLVKKVSGSWTAVTGFPIEQFINHAFIRRLITI